MASLDQILSPRGGRPFVVLTPCRCRFHLRFVSGPQSENQTILTVGSNMGRPLVVRALTMILGYKMKGTDLNIKQ